MNGATTRSTLLLLITLMLLPCTAIAVDPTIEQRRLLLQEVRMEIEQLGINELDSISQRVIDAMDRVPRHEFVPEDLEQHAYENRPLPIGFGQTISQPLIVALMTELLQIGPGDRVFELGTGSGYQAAILAELGAEVYSAEIVEPLGNAAADRLQRLGYDRVKVKIGDGYHGWSEAAPFDAIIVTAAGDHIPPPLVQQLKQGGKMVLPVGGHYLVQQLIRVTRSESGEISSENILPVSFVPLTGGH